MAESLYVMMPSMPGSPMMVPPKAVQAAVAAGCALQRRQLYALRWQLSQRRRVRSSSPAAGRQC